MMQIYSHTQSLKGNNAPDNVEIIRFDYGVEDFDVKENQILVIHETGDYLKMLTLDKYNVKLTILMYLNAEAVPAGRRLELLKKKNPLHRLLFGTTHLENDTLEYDLAFSTKMCGFKNCAFTKKYSDINFLNENVNKKRTKKFNFFNRTVNIRRLRAFELVKKNNINLDESYHTFGFILMDSVFNGIRKIQEYIDRVKEYSSVYKEFKDVLDIAYIESKENEFVSYEDREWHCSTPYAVQETNNIINENTLDSYAAFVIEGSSEMKYDMRFTEKSVRTFLFKSLSLLIKENGYNKALRSHGIQTFEDVFGLDANWDECGEVERMNKFVGAIDKFSKLSLKEVETIYFSEDIQKRLEINFQIIKQAFVDDTDTIVIREFINKIGYENNVFE
jgi:hypothetical protein